MWAFFAKAAALWIVNRLLSPPVREPDKSPPGTMSPPTADADRPIPVVWGTCKVQPNVFWWGDTGFLEFTYRGEFSGYEYFSGIAMVLCWGEIDEIVDIIFDNTRSLKQGKDAGYVFLQGGVNEFPIVTFAGFPVELDVDSPSLFGGPQKEGGIRGKMDLYFGTEVQLFSQYIQDRVIEQAVEPYAYISPWMSPLAPGDPNPNVDTISAYKNIAYVVFKRTNQDQLHGHDAPFKWGVTPQLKGVHFVIRRCPDSLGMPATAVIENATGFDGIISYQTIKNANAAHCIYELFTNTLWGLKVDPSAMDLVSFQECAQTLFDESLGVSIQETESREAYETIDYFCRHVDAVVIPHPRTGLVTMRLIRGDWETEDLLTVSADNSRELKFTRPSYSNVYTGVKVKWTDSTKAFREDVAEWQNQATLEVTNEERRQEIDLLGLTSFYSASVMTGRVGRALTQPFASATFIADRSVFDLMKGDPFILHYADQGIGPFIMRILDINYGSLDDGSIEITAMQDVFSGVIPQETVPPPLGGGGGVVVGDPSTGEGPPADQYAAGRLTVGRVSMAGTGYVGYRGSGALTTGGVSVAGAQLELVMDEDEIVTDDDGDVTEDFT